MNMQNQESLSKNLEVKNMGLTPVVKPLCDLPYKAEYAVNSWFAIGHTVVDEHRLNYLFHIMLMQGPIPVITSGISITDESNQWHYADEKVFLLTEAELDTKNFNISLPNGYMRGDLNKMEIYAHTNEVEINLVASAVGFPIYNGGTGSFPLIGATVYQYSIPKMITNGTITAENRTWKVQDGQTWFDRQWESTENAQFDQEWRWSWMDINLNDGTSISLWDYSVNTTESAWATIQYNDGSQLVCPIEVLSKTQSDPWTSPKTGLTYPTKWTVNIPLVDASLNITPSPMEQEVASDDKGAVPRYEGASSIEGVLQGRDVHGFGYVELVGQWH
ncbi:hypothetical protein LFAB_08320 [Lactiplantibacillus fabifermentans T30PCM01]|uniref:AttH domain-containing protein n=1 Tax=Lactiplantibacillus fabifermentans T30PCM01 TaxID=1400520 RepID=W6TCF0_9LACO|nr:lipocalin family protein [Lactiplantibacillus fabifermentans]ETY74275.1 hypothetical protein LFAB_08320 [Lactiplantibacillus fabifermentans T30PCM01]